ncbi:MAG: FkbM family methyltransferase [Vampirovibrionales bacterium]|nr:FkbM family methyltransferase [Vampirovibrionales bacterium]
MSVLISEKSTLLTSDAVVKSRDALLSLRDEVLKNPLCKFPAAFVEACQQIEEGQSSFDVVLFGYNSDLLHYLDYAILLEHLYPGQINMRAIVAVNEADAFVTQYRGIPVLQKNEFLNNLSDYAGAIFVDITIVWLPYSKYVNPINAAGLTYVRVEQFRQAPLTRIFPNNIQKMKTLYYLENFDQMLALESIFEDEKSICVFHSNMQAVISANDTYYLQYNDHSKYRYIPQDVDFEFGENEVYIDTGAFNGEDAIRFANAMNHRFKAIHSFEPEPSNFIKVTQNINRYIHQLPPEASDSFFIHPFGVWNKKSLLEFSGSEQGGVILESHGPMAGISDGKTIFAVDLDNYLDEMTYLKLEIEGSEKQALDGARGLILQHKPKLAVSVYHLPDDFIVLTEAIQNFDLGYRFTLRHHGLDQGTLCYYCQVPN